MKLSEQDARLAQCCRSVEAMLARAEELAGHTVVVRILPNFAGTDSRIDAGVLKTNPAFYDSTANEIVVDETNFLVLNRRMREATIAHEVAHFYRDRADAEPIRGEFMGMGMTVNEEIIADRLASRWGYRAEIATDRAAAYQGFGADYCRVLDSSDVDFANLAIAWEQRYKAQRG
jgi:hypothetical protein